MSEYKYEIGVHIAARDGIDFGYIGATEGPTVTVAKQALERLGVVPTHCTVGGSPLIDPPMVTSVVHTTSPIDVEKLKTKVEEVWPTVQANNRSLPPPNYVRIDTFGSP